MRAGQATLLGLLWLAGVNCRAPLFAVAAVLPYLVRDLDLSFTVAGAVTGLPLLMMGLASMPGGWLTDRFGASRTLAGASAVIAVSAAARALAPGAVPLLVATVVLGIGIGIVQPALPRVARETLPSRVGLASAIFFNGLIMGGVGSAAATPWLLAWLGGPAAWRPTLLAWTAVAVLGAVGWGAVAFAQRGRPVTHAAPRLTSLAPLRLSASIPGIPALTLAMGTQSAIFYTYANWLPTYLTGRGWTIEATAAPMAALTAGVMGASVFTAPLARAIGSRAAVGVGGAITVVGFIPFLAAPDAAAWISGLAIGIGTTIAFGIGLAAPAELAPASQVGTVAGFMLGLGYAEATLGPLTIGTLRDLLGSYDIGWWFVLALCVVLTLSALGVPSRRSLAPRPLS